MKSTVLWSLVVLNAILVYSLVGRLSPANAVAVPGRPSDYILLPGTVTGGASEVVYVIDTTNGIMGGMAYNTTTKTIDVMPAVNLNVVFAAGRGH